MPIKQKVKFKRMPIAAIVTTPALHKVNMTKLHDSIDISSLMLFIWKACQSVNKSL